MRILVVVHTATRRVVTEITTDDLEHSEQFVRDEYGTHKINSPFAAWWLDDSNCPKGLVRAQRSIVFYNQQED